MEPPALADLRAGDFVLDGQFVERGLGYLQILGQLVHRHDFVMHDRHTLLQRIFARLTTGPMFLRRILSVFG